MRARKLIGIGFGIVSDDLFAAQAGDNTAFERLVQPHENELKAHCYRMSGSLHDAEELVQETLLRAWKGLASFEGRSSLRTWLFRIATRVCLDELERRPARALPMDLGPANQEMAAPRLEPIWIEPCPTALTSTAKKEDVAFAFLVALQNLPPRQRAALILKDVVGYDAKECAELLEMSVAAVNSALQRARETLAGRAPDEIPVLDKETNALLQRYVRAWENADVEELVSLLREDAVLAMPPLPSWVQGAGAIAASLLAMVLPPDARGRFTLRPTEANGLPAFAMYEKGAPVALHVLELRDGKIAQIIAWRDPTLVARF